MTLWDYIESKMQETVEEYKSHLWKDAQGDDLPEIDREVIVLDKMGKVSFGHRPYHKSCYTLDDYMASPIIYDKGGWNIPNIVKWLDVEIPIIE